MPTHTPAEQAKNIRRANITPVGKPAPIARRVSGARKPKKLPSQASSRARPGVASQASSTSKNKLSELFKSR